MPVYIAFSDDESNIIHEKSNYVYFVRFKNSGAFEILRQ